MALTTHEQIRVESGFQLRFTKNDFLETPNGGSTVFHVTTDDNVKFVPEFSTGNTVAGASDVKVWLGLSGIGGVSRMGVVSVNIDSGSVTLDTAPDTGASLTVSYSSSPMSSVDVEDVRMRAESIISQRLTLCYNLPISPVPSVLTSLATRLSSALLKIRAYGTGSRDTADDGYRLYDILMGENEVPATRNTDQVLDVGEVGMICRANYQLVDDNGNTIPRNDSNEVAGDFTYVDGGRVRGRLYDITEEPFRYKESQVDVNKRQAGSGVHTKPPIQE